MKYCIIGSGGIGATVGSFLASAGHDVTFIARGSHLAAMKEKGLLIRSGIKGDFVISHPKAMTAAEYRDTPDVALVCVKGYSLDDAISLLSRTADRSTTVIPLLNIFGTGARLREALPGIQALDGCIYVTSFISAPGEITQGGKLLRVVFGRPDGQEDAKLDAIAAELEQAGIRVLLSRQIQADCFKKYALISVMASVGAYYDASTDVVSSTPEMRNTAIALSREIDAIAKAMGITFEKDVVETNLKMIDTSPPKTTASLQKDLEKGGPSEIDGLIFEPVRLGKKLGVAVPTFEAVAKKFGFSPKKN